MFKILFDNFIIRILLRFLYCTNKNIVVILCIHTFIASDTFGVRWEKGIAVKEGGFEMLSPEIPEVCPELHF